MKMVAPAMEEDEDLWVKVGSFGSVDAAFEHSLVLLSQGSGSRIQPAMELGQFDLEAPVENAGMAQRELRAYANESVARPEIESFGFTHESGIGAIFAWAVVLLISFKFQMAVPQWEDFGMNSSVGLVANGEWWRPLTSLFLHADVGHLLSNILAGALFASVLSRLWGAGKCWAAILFCGALGNVANSFLYFPERAFSLGASTAVMAVLGLLCAHGTCSAIMEWTYVRKLRRVIVPLAAGIAMFGLTGNSSDPEVNVLGHACGFSSGLIIGLPISWQDIRYARTDRKNGVA